MKTYWQHLRFLLYLIPVFILHYFLFQLPSLKNVEQKFLISILVLYLVYFILSAIILIIVVKVSKKNFDQVGMTFMILTSVKMAISFFIVRPILANSAENDIEKMNFFAVFILFLIIETLITIRLLNKKK
jgi:hypothetical protein